MITNAEAQSFVEKFLIFKGYESQKGPPVAWFNVGSTRYTYTVVGAGGIMKEGNPAALTSPYPTDILLCYLQTLNEWLKSQEGAVVIWRRPPTIEEEHQSIDSSWAPTPRYKITSRLVVIPAKILVREEPAKFYVEWL